MRVLILSCNTGEGHNSCAKAIKEYYDSMGIQCDIADGLSFVSDRVSRFISWGHVFVYRYLPWLFKFGYFYSERHPSLFREKSGFYRLMARGSEGMYEYIKSGGYDTVICTHVFAATVLTDALKKHPLNILTCFVATDYTCSPSTKDICFDWYFIPDESLAADFESPNIPLKRMIFSGIPVRQMFYNSCEKSAAKAQVGIPDECRHLLMMCGSMGCGPIKRIAKSLSEKLGEDCHLTVVCGTNEKLKAQLEKLYGGRKNVHIKGFVSDMSLMLDSADLYLTKPGGISVSEAAAKGIPMVFIDAVAGCEEYNRIHFIHGGGARTGSTVEELSYICLFLLNNEEKLERMKKSLKSAHKHNAAKLIYEFTEEKYGRSTENKGKAETAGTGG